MTKIFQNFRFKIQNSRVEVHGPKQCGHCEDASKGNWVGASKAGSYGKDQAKGHGHLKGVWIAACLVLVGLSAQAQNISTTALKWSVIELNDLNTNKKEATYRCSFVTTGNGSIQWVQKDNYLTELAVQRTSGTWTNVQAIGEMVYAVTLDGETGTITFARAASGVTILLELSNRIKHLYTVVQVVPN